MHVDSIHVLAVASPVPSLVDRGLCIGSVPSYLDVESSLHALGVGESVPNHGDRCELRRNSVPVDRPATVESEEPNLSSRIAWRGRLCSGQPEVYGC